MNWIVFSVSFLVIQIVFWFTRMYLKIKDLQLDKDISDKRIQELKISSSIKENIYQNEILSLKEKISKMQNECKGFSASVIPDGTIEAVKYAMIHNHPDNGGDAEKFILYKDCYDKLTGGR